MRLIMLISLITRILCVPTLFQTKENSLRHKNYLTPSNGPRTVTKNSKEEGEGGNSDEVALAYSSL